MPQSNEEKNLYRAVAELAYTIAKADNDLSSDEVDAFLNAIKETLGDEDWLIQKHFHLIQQSIQPDVEASYKHAIFLIEKNKSALKKVLIRKFMYVLEKVAEVMGVSAEETELINRFELDINQIYALKTNESNLKLDRQQYNLYTTVGQLAYVIAMADHVLLDEEIRVFKEVVEENLGEFDWLAEERFKTIDDLEILDVESTYEHSIHLIEKNVNALSEEMIQKFLNVIIGIAEVAGISKEEHQIIKRFREDVYRIYQQKGK